MTKRFSEALFLPKEPQTWAERSQLKGSIGLELVRFSLSPTSSHSQVIWPLANSFFSLSFNTALKFDLLTS